MSTVTDLTERQASPTEPIRAPRLLARKIRKLAQLRGFVAADYVEEHLGPQVERDWASLPDEVRKYVEKHLDD